MTAITWVTRGFFFFSRAALPMPTWLIEGLRYAPLAAMVAEGTTQMLTPSWRRV